jgi:hypothetical protein
MSGLPVAPAHRLAARDEALAWLIEGLWAEEAVGIVGGEPKSCKSFLALDIAVSVASGAPCLRRFAVARPGPVLLYAAEDAPYVVRRRLDGICLADGVDLAALDIQVITAPSLRLDPAEDRRKLTETVSELRPRLLVLDPFVRLHRIDENVSGEVAPLLGFLRELQRGFHLAVLVVHHARKGAARAAGGQALRGSSELHAWGDSNLYLHRSGAELSLSTEHRAALSVSGLPIALRTNGDAVALELLDRQPVSESTAERSAADRVKQALAGATTPLSLAALRRASRMRTQSLCDTLARLARDGEIDKTPRGYSLAAS